MNIGRMAAALIVTAAAAAGAQARDFEFRDSDLPYFNSVKLEIMINCFDKMPPSKGDRSSAGYSYRCGLERGARGEFTLRFHYQAGTDEAYDLAFKSARGGVFAYNEQWGGGAAVKKYADGEPGEFCGRTDFYDAAGKRAASNTVTGDGCLRRPAAGEREKFPGFQIGPAFDSLDRARQAMARMAALIKEREAKK